MRKSSCWMILVALLTITAPTAFADSLSIVFTGGGFGTPVDTSISAPTPGFLDLGTVTDMGATFTFTSPLTTTATPQTDAYSWIIAGTGNFQLVDTTSGHVVVANFSSGTPPAFLDSGTAVVTLNTVAAPEPSPVVLTLIGMGLLVAMRKRKSLGLAQAT